MSVRRIKLLYLCSCMSVRIWEERCQDYDVSVGMLSAHAFMRYIYWGIFARGPSAVAVYVSDALAVNIDARSFLHTSTRQKRKFTIEDVLRVYGLSLTYLAADFRVVLYCFLNFRRHVRTDWHASWKWCVCIRNTFGMTNSITKWSLQWKCSSDHFVKLLLHFHLLWRFSFF